MKEQTELRIWPDTVQHGYVTGWFLQRKKRRFLFFHRWENIGWFPTRGDALIAKVMFIPDENYIATHNLTTDALRDLAGGSTTWKPQNLNPVESRQTTE